MSCLHDAVQLARLNLTCPLWLLDSLSCSTASPDDFPLEGSPSPDSMVPFHPLLGENRANNFAAKVTSIGRLNRFCAKDHPRTDVFTR